MEAREVSKDHSQIVQLSDYMYGSHDGSINYKCARDTANSDDDAPGRASGTNCALRHVPVHRATPMRLGSWGRNRITRTVATLLLPRPRYYS